MRGHIPIKNFKIVLPIFAILFGASVIAINWFVLKRNVSESLAVGIVILLVGIILEIYFLLKSR